jgi:hypothetical protein
LILSFYLYLFKGKKCKSFLDNLNYVRTKAN